jgi:hypothetical protein
MNNNNHLLKVFFITAGIVIVVIIVGIMINANKDTNTKIEESNYTNTANNNQEELNTITASSSVNADIDAYLKSSNSIPSSNDFNDSYADLSQ